MAEQMLEQEKLFQDEKRKYEFMVEKNIDYQEMKEINLVAERPAPA